MQLGSSNLQIPWSHARPSWAKLGQDQPCFSKAKLGPDFMTYTWLGINAGQVLSVFWKHLG